MKVKDFAVILAAQDPEADIWSEVQPNGYRACIVINGVKVLGDKLDEEDEDND